MVVRGELDPRPLDVTGSGGPSDKPRVGGGIHRKPKNIADASDAMGIDWMSRKDLSQAIPPAYSKYIGEQLRKVLEAARTAE